MSRVKNIEELRDELLEAYEWVKADPRRANQVKEMTNAAGKVLGTVKTQLEYAMLRGERPEIEFLGKAGVPGVNLLGDAREEKPETIPQPTSAISETFAGTQSRTDPKAKERGGTSQRSSCGLTTKPNDHNHDSHNA